MKVKALSDEIIRKLESHPINKKREEEGLNPANVILLRGCAIKLEVESFNSKFSTKAISICPTAIIAGLTMSLGIDREIVEGATGSYDTDLNKKAEAAFQCLYKKDYEFCFLHIKGYDETGHDRHLDLREGFVTKTDVMLKLFFDLYEAHSKETDSEIEDCLVILTGDHSTPLYKGDHSFEPVPFALGTVKACLQQKKLFLSDYVETFDEIAARRGVLGRFPGQEVMPLIFKVRQRVQEKGFQ